jgi:hypothetical protein
LRRSMIELFARTATPGTTQALAHRAVFEPDPTTRRVATALLRGRVPAPARPLLLAALRYPWPTAADHAADALAALGDRGAVPALVQLLDAPDPAGLLSGDDGSVVVREVVRVSHLNNCLLCHAPSWDRTDVARSVVPPPDRPIPQPPSPGSPGSPEPPSQSPYGAATPNDQFVRIDVTYLRQDFSLMLDVEHPGLWPKRQRFDFFVRTRPARIEDVGRANLSGHYPQRDAVLRALRTITGQDFGDQAEDWRAGLKDDPRFRL